MTPDQLAALAAEVQGDPAQYGYAAHLPAGPGHVCDLLNAPARESMVKPRLVNARTILAECQPGAGDLLNKLEQLSAQSADVKWAVKFLQQDGGLDVGHPVTQAMLSQLAQGNALTSDEANKLKTLAVQPCSRAEKLSLPAVTEADLRAAGIVQE